MVPLITTKTTVIYTDPHLNDELDAISLRQRDPRLAALPNDEDVLQPSGEGVADSVLILRTVVGELLLFLTTDGTGERALNLQFGRYGWRRSARQCPSRKRSR